MKLFTATKSVFHNKCPRCHHGNVFMHPNPYSINNMFKMHTHCEHCHLLYEREPGFFFGAMFVSYAMIAAWFIFWFVIQNLFLHWDIFYVALTIGISGILLSPLTFRWSRLIWLNIFNSYKSDMAKVADK